MNENDGDPRSFPHAVDRFLNRPWVLAARFVFVVVVTLMLVVFMMAGCYPVDRVRESIKAEEEAERVVRDLNVKGGNLAAVQSVLSYKFSNGNTLSQTVIEFRPASDPNTLCVYIPEYQANTLQCVRSLK